MTLYLPGHSVTHLVGHVDHDENVAVSRCQRVEGEPVEGTDIDEDELCDRCMARSDQHGTEDDDEHGE